MEKLSQNLSNMMPFRDHSTDSLDSVGLLEESKDISEKHFAKKRSRRTGIILHSLAIGFYAAVTVALFLWGRQISASCECNGLISCKSCLNPIETFYWHFSNPIAPARAGVKYEKVTMTNDFSTNNPFRGTPRPEMDDAWSDMMQCEWDIRITRYEKKD